MKTLIVGPTTLELGWALCRYIPHARYRAGDFESVVVCVPPGEEYLVQDFATDYYYVKKPDRADRWLIKNGRDIKIPKEVIQTHPGSVWMKPDRKTCNAKKDRMKYFRYGQEISSLSYDFLSYDLVIHARSTSKYGQNIRNYPSKWFTHIVKKTGLRACSIGTQADHIEGTDDKRHINMEVLCNIIRSSKIVLGPSSGPMHLASLCGTFHIVFTDAKKDIAIRATNKQRYKKLWNPFQTPCEIMEDNFWRPHPDRVIKVIKEYLSL